jgi:hypothetical protein
MSVLSNLLPGLRDLRAPLSAGLLWLFAAYLAVAPLPSPPEGLIASIDGLREALGPIAQAAAILFVAYLVGSFVQEVGAVVGVKGLNVYLLDRAQDDEQQLDQALLEVAANAARQSVSRLETRNI